MKRASAVVHEAGPPGVGIDFGTTNSAVAIADEAGGVQLVQLPSGVEGEAGTTTWRTALFFEHDAPGVVFAGAPAIARYLETGGDGRFVQSIKSHLASALFGSTHIEGRRYSIEDLVTMFVDRLRRAAGRPLGRRAVVGRPVRYWGAETAADDERAIDRMRRAFAAAGFDDVIFEHEPVAAARAYASRLTQEELVLIADLGGGTTDFSLVRVGPGTAEVLGSSGVALGGDSFDGRIIDDAVAPQLGKDSHYEAEFGTRMVVPPWLFARLRRWHHLSFLKEASTVRLLEKIEAGTDDPAGIARLRALVDDELGLPLHRAIERAKTTLSSATEAELLFDTPGVRLARDIARSEFDQWIEPELQEIDNLLDGWLPQLQARAGDIDHVFTTGGSSFVPAVRRRLGARFGAEKIVGGGELTSVAWGLAASARAQFANRL